MKKTFLILFAFLGTISLGACSDFLDETADQSGSAYIYHMDQLYGLTGSIDLYLFDSPGGNSTGFYMTEPLVLTDAVEYTPEYYVYGLWSGTPEVYNTYCWKGESFKAESSMLATWIPAWERIYRFNTVLEHLDKVIQTTEAVRQQVEGEARFGRAYYHFMLLTLYSLWGDEKPGIGYREDTHAGKIPGRESVAYTLERIYEDLDLAEKALEKASRTAFDPQHNFRPTVPTVQAFRARVALYRGDYELALRNATAALQAHGTLVDFKNEPEYERYPYWDIYLLDETNTQVEGVIPLASLDELMYLGEEAVAKYEELYLPNASYEEYEGSHPISESFYNLWDRENDARWIYFYCSCNPLQMTYIIDPIEIDGEILDCITYENQQYLKPWNCYNYSRFTGTIVGMTTAEMYLVKAECEARDARAADAAETLKTLRRTRFMTEEAAERGITGSVQDVLDERLREMGAFWRFFDIKRLNGAEHAGIYIRRDILTDPGDIDSRTLLEIAPDDPRWALPFYTLEAQRMGWQQNEGWE